MLCHATLKKTYCWFNVLESRFQGPHVWRDDGWRACTLVWTLVPQHTEPDMVSRYLLSKDFCAFFCVQGSTLFRGQRLWVRTFFKCRVVPNCACKVAHYSTSRKAHYSTCKVAHYSTSRKAHYSACRVAHYPTSRNAHYSACRVRMYSAYTAARYSARRMARASWWNVILHYMQDDTLLCMKNGLPARWHVILRCVSRF